MISFITAARTRITPIATPQFVNMLLSLLVVLAVLLVSGKGINFAALTFLPLIMLVEYLLALGSALIASSVAVYIRDLQYLMGIITMAWQFLTPIMYGIEMVPERYLGLFYLNPMTPVILAYRDILYYKRIPEMQTMLSAIAFGIVLLVAGFLIFGKLKIRFAEEM